MMNEKMKEMANEIEAIVKFKRERNQLALRKSGEFFRAKILVKSSSSPDGPARLGYRRG